MCIEDISKHTEEISARKIQSVARRRQARNKLNNIKLNKSAALIQSKWRSYNKNNFIKKENVIYQLFYIFSLFTFN